MAGVIKNNRSPHLVEVTPNKGSSELLLESVSPIMTEEDLVEVTPKDNSELLSEPVSPESRPYKMSTDWLGALLVATTVDTSNLKWGSVVLGQEWTEEVEARANDSKTLPLTSPKRRGRTRQPG